MRPRTACVVALCLVSARCPALSPQGANGSLLFGTRFTEAALSGAAGSQTMPMNQTAALDSQGVMIVTPDPVTLPNAYEIVNFGGLVAHFGDTNGNNIHAESSDHGGGIDAIWVPGNISTPARWCDFFVSLTADIASAGITGGTAVTETEMILIQPAAPPLKLYTEAQLEVLLGMAPGSLAVSDVDAFTKDMATGDMYFSFTDTVTFNNGTAMAFDGDILVVLGAQYTPVGPFGIVSNPVGGAAFIGAQEAELATMITNLGVGLPTNLELSAIDLDPNGGMFLSLAGVAAIPNMIFTFENSGTTGGGGSSCVTTTAGGGAFFALNGIVLNNATAVGMNPTSFNSAFLAGSLDCLDVVPALQTRVPLTIDRFPNSPSTTNPIPTPGVLTYSLSGVTPGGPGAYIAVNTGPLVAGAAAYRVGSPFAGHCELYIDFVTPDPVFYFFAFDPFGSTLIAPNPVPVSTPPNYAMFTVTIPVAVPAGITLVFQAVDLADLVLSEGNEIRF